MMLNSLTFPKGFAVLTIADLLELEDIQAAFDRVPLDNYVEEGFRHKSLTRIRVRGRQVILAEHGPLFQPKEYNPVHGDIVRDYPAMDEKLAVLLRPAMEIFAAVARLGDEHEILVQAQRVTASSGDDGQTGFPVVEGWHRDNTRVLGILVINRVNVIGGISLLAHDERGSRLAFAQTLEPGDLVFVDDTVLWHNTTPIAKVRANAPAYRDVAILTWPSCRAPERALKDRASAVACS
jgi:hypothetical protein